MPLLNFLTACFIILFSNSITKMYTFIFYQISLFVNNIIMGFKIHQATFWPANPHFSNQKLYIFSLFKGLWKPKLFNSKLLAAIVKFFLCQLPWSCPLFSSVFYAWILLTCHLNGWFVCVEVLWPSQPNGVVSSAVSLPNHTFTGQA